MKFKSINKILNEPPMPNKKKGYRCVYFLIKDNEIIYVGQTDDLSTRLVQHKPKKYDRFNYIEADEIYADVIESAYIHLIRPSLNKTARNGKSKIGTTEKSAPISSDRIVEMLVNHQRLIRVMNEMNVSLGRKYYW